MGYTCVLCQEHILGGTRELAYHLHALHPVGGSGQILICGQDGCLKTFTLMNSFLRHIRMTHAPHAEDHEQHVLNDELLVDQNDMQYEEGQENYDMDVDILEPDVAEQEPVYDPNSLKQLAVSMIIKLRASTSLPYTSIQNVISGTNDMFQYAISSLKRDVCKVMENHGIDTNAADVVDLFTKFTSCQNPFTEIETIKQQSNYMIEHLMLVEPAQYALGTRFDQVIDRKTGDVRQQIVTDTFQYIPVTEVLKLILKRPVMNLIENEERSINGLLRGYQDGSQYKQHGLFRDYPNALRFQIFYDDVEVTNPIGSKAGVHKLGMFYYSIQNLPKRMNCTMNSIYLLAAAYSTDVKRYGFEPILRPFVKEMNSFESDDGVQLLIGDRMRTIHGSLVSLCADTLAAHDILGFLSPSANKLCRLCYATREGIQHHFNEDDFQQRTMDSHDSDVEIASQTRNGDNTTGVKRACPLDSLRNFHSSTNFNFDIMHDMLEGVCPYEVKLLLRQFICINRFLTVHEFNQRLSSFHYSFNDRKNKPSIVLPERLRNLSDHKLGQKAVQMWCFTRMLPLLIGDKIPHDNEHYELLLLLLRCMDVIFAPSVYNEQTVYLKHLIHDHHCQFKLKFPDQNMINKHHHMVHYPTCIRVSGPLTSLQCLKYEMKHAFSKKVASINCNFKNICKSIAYKHQIMQCAAWSGNGLRHDFECLGGNMTPIGLLNGSGVIAETLQLAEDEEIFVASQVTLYGTQYKPNLFLATGLIQEIPQFSCISHILVQEPTHNSVFFVVAKCCTHGFSSHFHAYEIKTLDPEYSVVTLKNLVDFHPLTKLTSYEDTSPSYLCPRYTFNHCR